MRIGLFSFFLCLNAAQAADCGHVQGDVEHRQCMANAFGVADKKLNATYAEMRRELDPGAREQLVKAQKAWLQFRDADCDFEAEAVRGGSAYQSEYIRCQLTRTRAREKELRESMNWPRGKKL